MADRKLADDAKLVLVNGNARVSGAVGVVAPILSPLLLNTMESPGSAFDRYMAKVFGVPPVNKVFVPSFLNKSAYKVLPL